MPEYLFQNTKTGEVRVVFYHMNDIKDYRGVDGVARAGLWRRIWTKPQASIDTQYDPYSTKDFVKITNCQGSIGDLWDRSTEASMKREDKEGKGCDPVKNKYFERYSKRRRGRKHPDQVRAEANQALAKKGIRIDWGNDD